MNELFIKYNEELTSDTQVDETNIKDQQMKLIANKHKWASRLIQAKQEFTKLEKLKFQTIEGLSQKIQSSSNVKVTDVTARRAAESHDAIKPLIEKLDEQKLLIEYLERVQDIMKSMTYDIKNIIDILKLETL